MQEKEKELGSHTWCTQEKKNNKKQKSIPKAKTKSNTSTAYEKPVYTVSVNSNAPSSNRSCINNPRNTNPAALSKTKKYREKADVQQHGARCGILRLLFSFKEYTNTTPNKGSNGFCLCQFMTFIQHEI